MQNVQKRRAKTFGPARAQYPLNPGHIGGALLCHARKQGRGTAQRLLSIVSGGKPAQCRGFQPITKHAAGQHKGKPGDRMKDGLKPAHRAIDQFDQLIDDAGDGSSWSETHALVHPVYRDVADRAGLVDLFLVDAEGRVLSDGPWAQVIEDTHRIGLPETPYPLLEPTLAWRYTPPAGVLGAAYTPSGDVFIET